MGRNIFLILYQIKKVKPLNDIIMMKVKVFASLMLAACHSFWQRRVTTTLLRSEEKNGNEEGDRSGPEAE